MGLQTRRERGREGRCEGGTEGGGDKEREAETERGFGVHALCRPCARASVRTINEREREREGRRREGRRQGGQVGLEDSGMPLVAACETLTKLVHACASR